MRSSSHSMWSRSSLACSARFANCHCDKSKRPLQTHALQQKTAHKMRKRRQGTIGCHERFGQRMSQKPPEIAKCSFGILRPGVLAGMRNACATKGERRVAILSHLSERPSTKFAEGGFWRSLKPMVKNFTTSQLYATSSMVAKKEKNCWTRVTCKALCRRSLTPTRISERPSF